MRKSGEIGNPQDAYSNLRGKEQMKIDCGKAHFKEFENLEYRVVKKVSELIN